MVALPSSDGELDARSFDDDAGDDVRDAVFGGRVRFARLTEFFLALSAHNVLLALLSARAEPLLAHVLGAAGLGHFFGLRVFGRDAVRAHGGSRAAVLRAELLEPLGKRASDALVVDADAASCAEVGALSCAVVHQPRAAGAGGGMGAAEFDAVQEWVHERLLGAQREAYEQAARAGLAAPSARAAGLPGVELGARRLGASS
ncbi:hypothetical protein KFE25_010964 [Diacronema lutheri]|uniref:Uncharacterized protein n=1 Tax=Diacronema lutheri TaxID=2081491 RepID=A0A8J5XB06_DIALT|nr:hypothetical protein KFE25_010964 [Diacronema lutheri]